MNLMAHRLHAENQALDIKHTNSMSFELRSLKQMKGNNTNVYNNTTDAHI